MNTKEKLKKLKEKLLMLDSKNKKNTSPIVAASLPRSENLERKCKEKLAESGMSPLTYGTKKSKKEIETLEESPYLDEKIDEFINWHFKEFVKGKYSSSYEYKESKEMRNLIEKIAVWYELKYPNYEVNRIIQGSAKERNEVTDEMKNVYSTANFINHLPYEEKEMLTNIIFPYTYNPYIYAYHYETEPSYRVFLKIEEDGTIISSEGVTEYSNGAIKDEFVEGLTLRKFYKLLKLKKINMTDDVAKYVKLELDRASKNKILHDKMLDTIMYRIIERGGDRLGSRRAFFFAKEFGRELSIPMKYIDMSDPGLGNFIYEYLKSGGREDIMCFIGYDKRKSDKEKIKTIPLNEVIELKRENNEILNNYVTSNKVLTKK